MPIRLDRLSDIRREMGSIYRASREGKLDPADLSRYVYALRSIAELVEAEQIESRIEALENQQNELTAQQAPQAIRQSDTEEQ